MYDKFWLVWVEGTPTTEKKHPNSSSAYNEAKRVARQPQNIGKKAYVLEATDYFVVELSPLTHVTL